MKYFPAFSATLYLAFTLSAASKTLTIDSLTGLPIIPMPDPLQPGNEPTKLPDGRICKSKMQSDFYSPNSIRVDATRAWYSAHLSDFKVTHGYASGRSQSTFYNADGSLIVSVTGSPGKEEENTETFGIVYAKFQPGIAEKTILGMNLQKIVCP
jgi:hypothetical protein